MSSPFDEIGRVGVQTLFEHFSDPANDRDGRPDSVSRSELESFASSEAHAPAARDTAATLNETRAYRAFRRLEQEGLFNDRRVTLNDLNAFRTGERSTGAPVPGGRLETAASRLRLGLERIESRRQGYPLAVATSWDGNISGYWDPETASLETQSQWSGGVHTAVHPITGEVETRRVAWGDIHAVWNPDTEAFEWNRHTWGGIHGVWNPVERRVEWERTLEGDIHGVWNPVEQRVHWERNYWGGVAVVWDPVQQAVDVQTEYGGGIAGFFNPVTQRPEFVRSWYEGVVIAHNDGDGGVRVLQGYYDPSWHEDEDEGRREDPRDAE